MFNVRYFIPVRAILFFSFLNVLLWGDNNTINASCPGEQITMLDPSAFVTADGKNGEGGIGYGGNDRYYIDFNLPGTLRIEVTNTDPSRNANHYFYVSKNSCGDNDSDWNIISAEYGKTHSASVDVSQGDRVYIRLQSIASEPNNGRFAYRIDLNFTPAPGSTFFRSGFKDFTLINPPSTRNILGNYAIAGNTVMCLTELYSGYADDEDECHGMTDFQFQTSNIRVSRYIDIDNDPVTWNSTSSYIELPESYDPDRGILWAGLFWQGRFSNDNDREIRYAKEGSNGFEYVEIGRGSTIYSPGDPIDLQAIGVHKIRLKVDNGAYQEATAQEVYTFESSNGVTYDAYADVTEILRNADMDKGKHVFTVANLKTAEGREFGPGLFGGWTLVVIYAEDFNGKLRNVSIYNGFTSLWTDTPVINISGFRLPKTGEVNAQISVFSGEGEYLYGRHPSNSSQDWIKISDSSDPDTFDYMPGKTAGTHVGNRDNMFDATFDGILRDSIPGKYNDLQINNDGVDVDRFDVSDLMTRYRDNNPDIQDIFIRVYSNNDYVTPGMIAFSTQLYRPRLCYDYVVRKDNFTLKTNDDRSFYVNGAGKLAYNVSIRSMEGDFDLTDVKLKLRPAPVEDLSFLRARYSPNPTNILIDAITTDRHTPPRAPEIALGNRATPQGGVISAFERYFSLFEYDLNRGNYNGTFEIDLNASIDYGSGPVSFILSTEYGSLPRCDQNLTYNPQWGMFNIERTDSGNYDPVSEPAKRFTLYTQTVGKDFDFSLVAYDAKATPAFSRPLVMPFDLSVEIELIDAKPYDDNGSFFKCHNTDQSIIQNLSSGQKSFFATIRNGTSRLDFTQSNDIRTDTALQNAVFRIWTLVDKEGNIIPHTCTDKNDDACFRDVYENYIQAQDTEGFCSDCETYVSERGERGCYACLRDKFAVPTCSRDNFAIKPASYHITVSDNNESKTDTSTRFNLLDNKQSTPFKAASGYFYRLEVNATRFESDLNALGYYQPFLANGDDLQARLYFDTNRNGANCADTNNTNYALLFENGELVATDPQKSGKFDAASSNNLFRFSNVGAYRFHFEDRNWTLVDQQRYRYKTFPGVDDCKPNDASVATVNNDKSGCYISSRFSSSANHTYNDLSIDFYPYAFSLENLTITSTTNPDNVDFVYMSDLDRSLQVSVAVNALLRAVAKGDANETTLNYPTTSNFTKGCAATDLTLRLGYTTVPSKSNLSNPFQQYLVAIDANISSPDGNLTFAKTNFLDANNSGSALVEIRTNFKRPTKSQTLLQPQSMNPVDVNYTQLEAFAPDAAHTAHLQSDRIAQGRKTIGANRFFYYAKADVSAPWNERPLISYGENISFNIGVSVFCSDPVAPDVNCSNMGLLTALYPIVESKLGGNWHRMTSHDGKIGEGKADIDTIKLTPGGASTNVNPQTNLYMDSNGTTRIDVFYPLSAPRSQYIDINFSTDPWLEYDAKIQLQFHNPSFRWKGAGKTGNVVDEGATSHTHQKRLSW